MSVCPGGSRKRGFKNAPERYQAVGKDEKGILIKRYWNTLRIKVEILNMCFGLLMVLLFYVTMETFKKGKINF